MKFGWRRYNMRKQLSVLNVPIDVVTMDDTVYIIDKWLLAKESHIVVTANAEMVMQAQEDDELSTILEQADLVLADGAGVVWASKHNGSPLPERVAGADLVNRIFALAASKQYRIFLLGAAPGVAEQAVIRAQSAYQGIEICGVKDGYFTAEEEAEVFATIKAAKPDILLAGLGVPRQEKWLWHNKELLGISVCMGVGGVIDVLAGVSKRAPLWMQQAGLEWAYRLFKQPSRIGRMLALPKFFIRVLREGSDKNS
jgi:N-acetylglucosaminyldiphosphoundecaprenol N-acetyl-beta-D-mannosaminyltransferase